MLNKYLDRSVANSLNGPAAEWDWQRSKPSKFSKGCQKLACPPVGTTGSLLHDSRRAKLARVSGTLPICRYQGRVVGFDRSARRSHTHCP